MMLPHMDASALSRDSAIANTNYQGDLRPISDDATDRGGLCAIVPIAPAPLTAMVSVPENKFPDGLSGPRLS